MSDDDSKQANEQIMKMADARSRDGMKPMTDDEILLKWQHIRDGTLEWMSQSVKFARSKGTKEAEQMYNTACRHIDNIERKRENLR